MKIKVLFLVRPDIFSIQAGDTVQIINLQKNLQQIGVEVDISYSLKPDCTDYDLIHCFNLLRIDSCLPQCREVKNQGKPLILTPIYWDLTEYLKNVYPERVTVWEQQQRKRVKALKLIDLLAPNGWNEYFKIVENFGFSLPIKVIYNGVEKDYGFVESRETKEDFILMVGRIHPRKNQLSVIKALDETRLPLLIVGKVNDKQYYRLCCEAVRNNKVSFIGNLDRLDLKSYYKKCRVHVLVSWYETPGLVNLEAASFGCSILTTDRGLPPEYFGQHASYCSPDDISQIRKKIMEKYNEKPKKGLPELVQRRFTWDKIALSVKEIYTNFL